MRFTSEDRNLPVSRRIGEATQPLSSSLESDDFSQPGARLVRPWSIPGGQEAGTCNGQPRRVSGTRAGRECGTRITLMGAVLHRNSPDRVEKES